MYHALRPNPAVKPLQERSHSCRASGARPAGSLARPHGKLLQTRREGRPISRLQHLRELGRRTRRCSGATVEDSPGGPLKNGEIPLKTCRKPKLSASFLKRTRGTAHAAVAPAAHQGGPLKGPLEQAPPRSRARTSLERAPPHSRALYARTPVPARGYGHLML
jgi:hypothetical protein